MVKYNEMRYNDVRHVKSIRIFLLAVVPYSIAKEKKIETNRQEQKVSFRLLCCFDGTSITV